MKTCLLEWFVVKQNNLYQNIKLMKIGFINPFKLTWSLIWRSSVLAATVLTWGYILTIFLIFGLLKLGCTEIINFYISNYGPILKTLTIQHPTLSIFLGFILLAIILFPIYYYPFQRLNHLDYNRFILIFYKGDHPASPKEIFFVFYLLFQGITMCIYGLWIITNIGSGQQGYHVSTSQIDDFTNFTEILALYLSFFFLCRFPIKGYHFRLAPKACKKPG